MLTMIAVSSSGGECFCYVRRPVPIEAHLQGGLSVFLFGALVAIVFQLLTRFLKIDLSAVKPVNELAKILYSAICHRHTFICQ